MTADFNVTTKVASMYSHRSLSADQEIRMTYGKRSNQDLFLYSGFVDVSCIENDSLKLWALVPQNDPFYAKRAQVLSTLGLKAYLLTDQANLSETELPSPNAIIRRIGRIFIHLILG